MNTQQPNTSTINPGDRIIANQSIEEKAKQIAVDTPDITLEHTVIPTYFIVEDQDSGEKEALHHVRDAEEISDVIRQARMDENGDRKWW